MTRYLLFIIVYNKSCTSFSNTSYFLLELKRLLNGVGFPNTENVVHELNQRHGSQSQQSLDWKRFCSSWNSLLSLPSTTAASFSNKVENASLFSSIAYVSSLDIHDIRSSEVAKSSQARLSFAITMDGHENEPLLFTCSTEKERNTWVESIQSCLIFSLEKSSERKIAELRGKLGWQHLVVRSSFTSLVIMNEPESLEQALRHSVKDGGSSHRERWTKLNALDSYNQYAALHYAIILGHNGCIDMMLRSGASIDLEDGNGLSPMIHGEKSVINIISLCIISLFGQTSLSHMK